MATKKTIAQEVKSVIKQNTCAGHKIVNETIAFMKTDNSKFDKDGKLKQGLHQEYFKNGFISCEGNFKDGERTGEWKYYLANGQLKAIGN